MPRNLDSSTTGIGDPFSSYWLSTEGIFINMTSTVALVAIVAAKIG